MSARAEILERIRAALQDGARPAAVVRDYRGAGVEVGGPSAVSALFAERVADYRADVLRCAPGEVAAVVAERLRVHGASTVGVDAGLPAQWRPPAGSGFDVVVDDGLSVERLDALDAVITSCRCAIATTGTVVLDHGPGQGRRALTLVPDVHLVIVTADQVVGDVPDGVAHLTGAPTQTWISGPSATSDIELERVEGVHGPRTLDIVLVDRPRT